MAYLGEAVNGDGEQAGSRTGTTGSKGRSGSSGAGYPAPVARWMEQNDVRADALDRVFHFDGDDGAFELLHSPGKSKREQTINTYILTGLGRFLAANERTFDDKTAREFCETIGCFDRPNHAKAVKGNDGAFTGNKSKGYSLTNVGLKRAAGLVKEVVSSAK